MSRLIDANKCFDAIVKWAGDEECTSIAQGACKAAEIVANAPTVDAVLVVRCKDCKHRPIDSRLGTFPPFVDDYGDWTCPYLCYDDYYSTFPDDNSFCDKGERKVEE